MRPSTPAEALALPCSALRDLALSLDIRCACGRTVIPPFRLMLIERPQLAGVTLGRLVPRIRCQACGQVPVRVELLHAQEHAAWAGSRRSGVWPWGMVLVGG